MFTPINTRKTKFTLYLLMILGLSIAFSCNKDDWWRKYRGGMGGNKGCIDKTRINPARPCANVYAPVCGCDGKEYANQCEAEKNGVVKFTKGKCKKDDNNGGNDGCFDKSKYKPDALCSKEYNPVCGCDGKDYSNPCEADKNGIIKYTMGKCKKNPVDSCYDKSRYNPNAPCTKEYNPVCGCDGKDYGNPCEADRNGVVKYTLGKCKSDGGTNNDCIDKTKYDPNKACTEELNPVCGCDGKDYSNPCQAEKSGVVKWTKGRCSGRK